MNVKIVPIQNDADLAEAQDRVTSLMASEGLSELAQLRDQALLVAAYEAERWPREPINLADVIQYITDQHDLDPADSIAAI